MNALDQFSIPVSGLRDGLHEYDFSIGREFFQCFQESPIEDASVKVHFLFVKSPSLFELTFEFKGTVKVTCDRCLDEFDLPIRDQQVLLVKFDEKEWEDTDIIYVLRGTPKLNVAKYIYEFINLAVPMVRTHDDAGERCNPAMLKYLTKETAREEDTGSSLWDALKGFNSEN